MGGFSSFLRASSEEEALRASTSCPSKIDSSATATFSLEYGSFGFVVDVGVVDEDDDELEMAKAVA